MSRGRPLLSDIYPRPRSRLRPQVNDADRLVIRKRRYLRHEQLSLWHMHSHPVLRDLPLGVVEGDGAMQCDRRQDLCALVGRDGPYTLTPSRTCTQKGGHHRRGCMWSTRLANAKRRTLLDASRSWSYESIRRRSTDSRMPKPIGARPSLGTLLPSRAGACVKISTSPKLTAARRLLRRLVRLRLSSSELLPSFVDRAVCGSTVRRSTASGLLGPSCTTSGPAQSCLVSDSSSSGTSSALIQRSGPPERICSVSRAWIRSVNYPYTIADLPPRRGGLTQNRGSRTSSSQTVVFFTGGKPGRGRGLRLRRCIRARG